MRFTRHTSRIILVIVLLLGGLVTPAFAQLTGAQLDAIKADIATRFPNAQAGSDGSFAIADAYNLPASPDFYVYRTAVPASEVFDAITWANFTPSDSVPTDTALNNAIYQSRQLACQTKQMNLQTMLSGRESLDATKTQTRAGLQDALTNIPSGVNGAIRAAGWTTLRDSVIARKATIIEKLLATGNGGTAATAAVMGFQGPIAWQQVDEARNR